MLTVIDVSFSVFLPLPEFPEAEIVLISADFLPPGLVYGRRRRNVWRLVKGASAVPTISDVSGNCLFSMNGSNCVPTSGIPSLSVSLWEI